MHTDACRKMSFRVPVEWIDKAQTPEEKLRKWAGKPHTRGNADRALQRDVSDAIAENVRAAVADRSRGLVPEEAPCVALPDSGRWPFNRSWGRTGYVADVRAEVRWIETFEIEIVLVSNESGDSGPMAMLEPVWRWVQRAEAEDRAKVREALIECFSGKLGQELSWRTSALWSRIPDLYYERVKALKKASHAPHETHLVELQKRMDDLDLLISEAGSANERAGFHDERDRVAEELLSLEAKQGELRAARRQNVVAGAEALRSAAETIEITVDLRRFAMWR